MPCEKQVEDRYIKTSDAAYVCGVSQWYLKQCRECYPTGFLKDRIHYILGTSRTAQIKWNVNAVLDAFCERGKLVRTAEAIIKEVKEGINICQTRRTPPFSLGVIIKSNQLI